MSLIREIKNKLTPAQTKIFRETCFGHWLDIKCDDNDPGYIHCLLMNQTDSPKKFVINGREICEEPEELWFRVTRDHVIRCGRCEFCLVTRMRFGPVTSFIDWIGQERSDFDHSVSSRVFIKRHSGQRHLSEFHDAFFKDELKGTDKDKVIVAIALIINLCFLGKQLRDSVNDDMLLLLEDFELMNKYPWGSFLWTKLYNSLHHVLVPYKERVADKTRKGVMTYHLSGFTWAFKMWIWEAYKHRIEAYAFKPESEGIPRGIHWKRKKKVMGWNEYVELMQLPDDIPDEERPLNRLRPTKTEVKCEWWVASVNYFKNPDAKVPVKKVDDPKKFDDETKKELTDMIKNLTKRLDDQENKHAKEIKEMSDRVEAGIRVTRETLKIVQSLYEDGGFIGGYVSDVEVQTTKKDMFDNVKVASPIYVRRSKRDH
ncbi:uncharacterized protein [Rutidosis leptorrhynchoides]|uniref:uncharacterized protein n=1 Tax=Rutidosis leptorrhynchoides TaxID=125765 RepID=UPI003A98EA88